MKKQRKPENFSDQLESWLKGKQPKTLETLISRFEDKSFAVVMLLLMLLPALPIPTGGITHVFEIVVALLALEQIAGLKSIWLPGFLSKRVQLGKVMQGKTVGLILKRVRWLEQHSNPRWQAMFHFPFITRITGLVVLGFTAVAFFSPPFSGLDTLPSLGVVLISLGLVLEDAVLLAVGFVIGLAGVVLSIGFGKAIISLAHRLFH